MCGSLAARNETLLLAATAVLISPQNLYVCSLNYRSCGGIRLSQPLLLLERVLLQVDLRTAP